MRSESQVQFVADVVTSLDGPEAAFLERLLRSLPRVSLDEAAARVARTLGTKGLDGAFVTGPAGDVVGLVTIGDLAGPRLEKEAA